MVDDTAEAPAPKVLHDGKGPEFDGLDPWLAQRVSAETAGKFNPDYDVHPTVFPEYLVCLEDGACVKILRSHVAARFQLSLEQYLARWRLPDNYPACAPNYTEGKRAAARKAGFGKPRPTKS